MPAKHVLDRPSADRTTRYRALVSQAQVIKPINGDPFIGMLETPVTSAPIVSCPLFCTAPSFRQQRVTERWRDGSTGLGWDLGGGKAGCY